MEYLQKFVTLTLWALLFGIASFISSVNAQTLVGQ